MTAISRGLPGWFRRGRGQKDEPADGEEKPQASPQTSDASVPVTGGEGETEPVVVWEAQNRMEAEVVKGHLESEGIPALITGDVAGRIFGFHTGDLAKASVLVPAPLADRARAILESALDDDENVDENIDENIDETLEDVDTGSAGDQRHGSDVSEA
jgi:hypothetical protein